VVRRIDDADRLFDHLQGWLEADVSNWAQCDDLCIKPLYLHLKRHHHQLDRVYRLGSSSSPWCRRASNVALVKFVGRSKHFDLDRTLANCERLLPDKDPYVQKGIVGC
jgi:3-methyladenine DNA glycosylase AlkD